MEACRMRKSGEFRKRINPRQRTAHHRDAGKKKKSGKKKASGVFVRRAKASVFSGCNSHPATGAPAGSNRSGDGGNEIVEAFDGKCRKAVPRAGRP
jgi:hypothetical protein